ncbi:unnamed protein product [Rotaria sordida]|uniref:Uncharacterized protein n=1 Tax=Rotaria sordida TaxID=392033 RepID=A0A818SC96_9BILA|nr:unnamed protein product [Rotaria sordida]CAF1056468.1 unnamed protein product [Rotaria sordida]CAF1187585.1 unnamed protein product [Rotaria sordida]CAF1187914.1 unnamed protein product [Rotaria sordida]CAF1201461.1 unnamed protein product [Rotaria sordida]
MSDDERKSWPEYVGKDANEVEQKLQAEGYNTQVLPQGSPTTRDYRLDRVRLFVDGNNKVVQTPING